MKLAVVGGRSFDDYSLLRKSILQNFKGVKIIVSGGAKGADSLGERYAREFNLETLIFLPDWSRWGKTAGYVRNQDIIKNADYVIAFWDGKSKGTKSSIDIAKSLGKEVIVIMYTPSIRIVI